MSVVKAHTLRVQRLYRGSLKCLLNWCVHRDLFLAESLKLRADFEAHREQKDARVIEKLVSASEMKLTEFAHPDTYTRALSRQHRIVHPDMLTHALMLHSPFFNIIFCLIASRYEVLMSVALIFSIAKPKGLLTLK